MEFRFLYHLWEPKLVRRTGSRLSKSTLHLCPVFCQKIPKLSFLLYSKNLGPLDIPLLLVFVLNRKNIQNTVINMLASRSSYTLSPIRTNYGKFSIKFQGAKIWNSLSEETKSLHRLAFKKTLKREIILSY